MNDIKISVNGKDYVGKQADILIGKLCNTRLVVAMHNAGYTIEDISKCTIMPKEKIQSLIELYDTLHKK